MAGARFRMYLKALGGYVLLALLFRFLTFNYSVIGHDESTYLVIAEAMCNGNMYWVDVIDTKPIGIFGLFAGIQALFGKSILASRLAATIWVAATAFGLYLAKRNAGSHQRAAVASGLMYIALTSVFTSFGVSPNAELYFNLFIIVALWAILQNRLFTQVLAGLSLGFGFVIKYVVLFDALAMGLFFLVRQYAMASATRIGPVIRSIGMGIGFALPFLGVWWYYDSYGHGGAFTFYTFELSGRYLVEATPWQYVKFFLDFNLRFFPVTVPFYYALFSNGVPRWQRRLVMLWGGFVWFGILLPGKFHAHYTVQFMLPLCFLAAELYGIASHRLPRWIRWYSRPVAGLSCLAIFLAVILYFHKTKYLDRPDYPREVAAFLSARLSVEDKIYTTNADHIVYYLTDRPSPTPYVHASLLWEESHIHALKIDAEAEARAIFKHPPRFVITGKPLSPGYTADVLREKYREVTVIGGRKIYERQLH